MRWWADDADFQSDADIGTPDVFVFGGIVVPEGHQAELVERVQAVKAKYGHARAPIKWNFKDAARFYGGSEQGQNLFESMSNTRDEWRSEIFDAIAESKITIVVAAIEAFSSDKEKVIAIREDCARRAFANALMRYALHVQEQNEWADAVIDWPAGDNRTPFNDEYHCAFKSGTNTDGQEYHSGPMSNLPMADSLFYSTTRYSCMLQLADMVVGASRDFLRACLLGKEYGPGFAMVKRIRDRYRGAPDKIPSRGLNISSGNVVFRDLVTKAIFRDLYDRPWPKATELPF